MAEDYHQKYLFVNLEQRMKKFTLFAIIINFLFNFKKMLLRCINSQTKKIIIFYLGIFKNIVIISFLIHFKNYNT